MTLGNMLRERDVQYTAVKDEVTNTWRVLNTWHDALKQLQVDDDVPDDSEAVTVLTEGAFIALIKEAARTGILENGTFVTGEAEHEEALLDKDQEIMNMRDELMKVKEETSKIVQDNTHSEEYVLRDRAIIAGHDLKEKAMENILKLVSLQDVSNLGSEK